MGLGEGQDSQETCHKCQAMGLWAMFACVDLLFISWLLCVAHSLGAEGECVVWETHVPPGAQIKRV